MRFTFAALALLAASLIGAWTFQGKPFNDTCPVKNQAIKPGNTTTYMGKVIGFC
jgi:hypothetical protein